MRLSCKLLDRSVVFFAALLVYLSTMPRTVVLEDDGEFILSSFFNGISHSPGYPLHTLLGHLFSLIPLGTVASRVHALSAFLGALTCVVLFCLVHRSTRCRSPAYAASLSYAFSSTFWSQAIIAEVYTLNTLLFFGLLALALRLRSMGSSSGTSASFRSDPSRLFLCFSFLYGLSLANHWPLIVLSTPCLVVILWPRLALFLRTLHLQILALLLGLAPYLWMYLHSQSEPPISFFGALESWGDLLHHVSLAVYRGSAPTAGWGDKREFLAFALLEILRQFSFFGTALAAAGMLLQRRFLDFPTSAALVLAFIANGVGLSLLNRADYDALHETVFQVFPLISYGVLAIWMGFGCHQLLAWLRRRAIVPSAAGWPGFALALALIVTTFFVNLERNNRRDYRWAERFARLVLESLPAESILFVAPDPDVFPIGYLHLVEGVRPDVTLMSPFGLIFGNRLYSHLRTEPKEQRKKNTEFITASDREIFFIPPLPADVRWESLCLYGRVLRSSDVASSLRDPCEGFLQQLDWLIDEEAPDTWTRMHQEDILGRALPWLVAAMTHSPEAAQREVYRGYIDRIARTVKTKVILVQELNRYAETFPREERLALLAQGKALVNARTRKSRHAQLYYEEGKIYLRGGDVPQAQRAFERSIEIWPHGENAAARPLFDLYRESGNRAAYHALRERLYGGG